MVNERTRHELYESARAALGDQAAETLMEMLPPVGWGDVATKHDILLLKDDLALFKEDLVALEERIDLRFDAKLARLEGRFQEIFRKHVTHMWVAMVAVGGFYLTLADVLGRT